MASMITHQELLEQGMLAPYTPEMQGRVCFISHQWLGYKHPDPNVEQSNTERTS